MTVDIVYLQEWCEIQSEIVMMYSLLTFAQFPHSKTIHIGQIATFKQGWNPLPSSTQFHIKLGSHGLAKLKD